MLPILLLILALGADPAKLAIPANEPVELASRTFSLSNRYGNTFVNDVFKDNILLTLKYMEGEVEAKDQINWEEIEKPFHYEFRLNPGEGFAFHDILLPKYAQKVVKTTNARFNYTDGFKSDGFLVGDGVCHLASFIYWVAKDAGLEAYAPSDHSIAKIPDVPDEYGVGIYVRADTGEGPYSNLYIVNTKEKPIVFTFDYKDRNLEVAVKELNSI